MSVHTSGPELESGARTAGRRPARRADIDGLRGLAIALVVIFHVWFGRVSGGVDVFLALSGFFFVGTLLRTADSSAPLDPRPVLRRIGRRLLPPLVVVLTAVAAATVVLRPFTQWLEVADQTGASLLFFQNWYLARTASDYLAADPMVSPLQHLWSIAVQGQFYIAALVVVFGFAWLLRRMSVPVRLPLTVLLAALTAASLAYAVLADRPQSWMYYDSAARAWELTLGGLLMCLSPWLRVPRALRIVLGALGLAVLLGCGFVLDGNSLFPGPWALVPVGAAMALVVAGIRSGSGSGPDSGSGSDSDSDSEHDTPSARLLASAPMVRLGAIAYALYLWHWPILIGYLIVLGHPSVGLVGGLIVIALSLLLAEASTRWFEDPIRRVEPPRPSRTALVGLVTVLAVTLVGAANLWHTHVDRSTEALEGVAALPTELYPGAAVFDPAVSTEPQPVQPPLLVAHRDLPPATLDNCIAQHTNRAPLTCTYGDPLATRRMVIVGGRTRSTGSPRSTRSASNTVSASTPISRSGARSPIPSPRSSRSPRRSSATHGRPPCSPNCAQIRPTTCSPRRRAPRTKAKGRATSFRSGTSICGRRSPTTASRWWRSATTRGCSAAISPIGPPTALRGRHRGDVRGAARGGAGPDRPGRRRIRASAHRVAARPVRQVLPAGSVPGGGGKHPHLS